jgi:broad specificity phosphatase PhoE
VLQGRRHDPPLTPLGIRQAEATRDFLAIRPIDHCYCSPLRRAVETAAIVAAPHGVRPVPLEALIECDVGHWGGLDWQTIRRQDPDAYQRFMADPTDFGYPGGESFADVYERVQPCIDKLFSKHMGQSVLVIAHHVVHRTYLAGVLGLPLGNARQVILDNCGISIVVREKKETTVSTLNAAFHLQGVAA